MILDARDLLEALTDAKSSVLENTPQLLARPEIRSFLNAYKARKRVQHLEENLEEFLKTFPESESLTKATQIYLDHLRAEKLIIHRHEVEQLSQIWDRAPYLEDPFAATVITHKMDPQKAKQELVDPEEVNVSFKMRKKDLGIIFPQYVGADYLISTQDGKTSAIDLNAFDYFKRQEIIKTIAAPDKVHGPVLSETRNQEDILEAVRGLSPSLLEGEHVVKVIILNSKVDGDA